MWTIKVSSSIVRPLDLEKSAHAKGGSTRTYAYLGAIPRSNGNDDIQPEQLGGEKLDAIAKGDLAQNEWGSWGDEGRGDWIEPPWALEAKLDKKSATAYKVVTHESEQRRLEKKRKQEALETQKHEERAEKKKKEKEKAKELEKKKKEKAKARAQHRVSPKKLDAKNQKRSPSPPPPPLTDPTTTNQAPASLNQSVIPSITVPSVLDASPVVKQRDVSASADRTIDEIIGPPPNSTRKRSRSPVRSPRKSLATRSPRKSPRKRVADRAKSQEVVDIKPSLQAQFSDAMIKEDFGKAAYIFSFLKHFLVF